MESGFSQADVATWAYRAMASSGKPERARPAPDRQPRTRRCVRGGDQGQHRAWPDLKGKRVALDEPGSGHAGERARHPRRLRHDRRTSSPEYIKPNQAGDKMRTARSTPSSSPVARHTAPLPNWPVPAGGIDILPITGPRPKRWTSRILRRRRDRRRHLQGRGAGEDASRSARNGSPATRPMPTPSTKSQGLFGDAAQKALAAGHAKKQVHHQENAVRRARASVPPGAEVLQGKPAC